MSVGSIQKIVQSVSDDLVAELEKCGLPALSDGKILLGSQHIAENSDAPRVIFVPDTSSFELGGAPQEGGTTTNRAERLRQLTEKARMQETLHFAIHVWGLNPAFDGGPDEDADYDATRDLYHRLIVVMHRSSVGTFAITGGKWVASEPASGPQMARRGRSFVFGAQWRTPVVDLVAKLVQPGTTGSVTATAPGGESP